MSHPTKLTLIKKIGMNRVITLLTMSDLFTWGIYMVFTAFIGIYVATKFGESALEIVGVGVACFNFSRGFFQIPIGYITDRITKDRDDIAFLTFGNLLMGAPYLVMPFMQSPVVYYIAMFIIGLGGAMNLVNWRKLFAKNLVEGKEGLNYATYDTFMSISMIIFGLIFGFISGLGEAYFDAIVFGIGILIMSSGIWSLSLYFVKDRKSG